MTGREKVVKWLNDRRAKTLPKVSDAFADLPAGYRKLLAQQAGFPEVAAMRLEEMTVQQREKLLEANHRLSVLASSAGELLFRSIPAKVKPRG